MITKLPSQILTPETIYQLERYYEVKRWYQTMFDKYQDYLVEICNNPVIQDQLGIPVFSKVWAVNPAGYSVFDGWIDESRGKAQCHAVISAWDKLGYQLQDYLRVLETIEATVIEDFDKGRQLYRMFKQDPQAMLYNFMFDSTTIDASSGSNGIRVTGATSWANARTAADGSISVGTWAVEAYREGTVELARAALFFNLTTVVPAGASIDTGTELLMPPFGNYSNTDGITLHIVSSTATDPISATSGQYNAGGSTSFGSKAWSNFSGGASGVDIEFDATGRANVTPNAVNKFFIKSNLDINNTAPSNSPVGNGGTGTMANTDMVVVFTPAITSSIKKMDGVTQANLKKVSGVAIASVKKVMGISNT